MVNDRMWGMLDEDIKPDLVKTFAVKEVSSDSCISREVIQKLKKENK